MSTRDPKGYYDTLAVDPTASASEIKAAFRRLAKLYHPDTNIGVESVTRFKAINEAYQVLGRPAKRLSYDTLQYTTSSAGPARSSQSRAAPEAARSQGAPPYPIRCSKCGAITAQPRARVFCLVISFLIVSVQRPMSGIFCARCARRTGLYASLISAIAGWWSVPGLFLTVINIITNGLGGSGSRRNDERLLWHNAVAFFMAGDLTLACGLAQRLRSSRIKEIAINATRLISQLETRGVSSTSAKLVDAWRLRPLEFLAHLAILSAVPFVVIILPALAQNPLAWVNMPVNALSAQQERSLTPLTSFRECIACPQMVVVPAGRLTPRMTPNQKVEFARPFAVGQFAISFAEWDSCVDNGGCNRYRPGDGGWGRGTQPVISVSWEDAKNYVEWLSHITGKPYRLLAEAEYEYVSRAGTTMTFWWGNSISTSQANYDGNRGRTVPVNSFAPNPWGFYQLIGNVWEWMEDCFREDRDTSLPLDGSAWVSGNCSRRVALGGSWLSAPSEIVANARHGFARKSRGPVVGFRVARTMTP
jgi:formylglycine-generating enzyme required for sulfatase activity